MVLIYFAIGSSFKVQAMLHKCFVQTTVALALQFTLLDACHGQLDADQVRARWADYSQKLKTVDLSGRRLFISGAKHMSESPSHSTFSNGLQSYFGVRMDDPIPTEAMLRKFAESEHCAGMESFWGQMDVRIDGANVLNSTVWDGEVGAHTIVRTDGKEIRHSAKAKQADIVSGFTAGKVFNIGLIVPAPNWMLSRFDKQVSSGDQEYEFYTEGGNALTLNKTIGVASHFCDKVANSTQEKWFLAPHEVSGLYLPRIVLNISSIRQKDNIQHVHIVDVLIIDKLLVNTPILEERFRVSVPAGTVVVSEGIDGEKIPVRTKEDLEDVTDINIKSRPGNRLSSKFQVMLVLSVFFVICVFIIKKWR